MSDVKAAEGKMLRVGLPAGAPVLSPFLEYPRIVYRGQQLVLTLPPRR